MTNVGKIFILLALSMGTSVSAQSVANSMAMQNTQLRPALPKTGLQARISIDLDGMPFVQALNAIARQSAANIAVGAAVKIVDKRITLKATDMVAQDAFLVVLKGTPVKMNVAPDGQILFDVATGRDGKAQGAIVGRVTDVKTGKNIVGANVSVGNDMRGVTTNEDGSYRLAGLSTGTHTVSIRLVGYAKQSRTVTVGEGATVTADFKLEPSANVLDQVIVTGTVVQTELKAVPTAITVITAKQIEERGITRIDQLFRGDIPGLFAQNRGSDDQSAFGEVTMFSRGTTSLNEQDLLTGTNTYFTNTIKTYVDGVELANSKYLSQIDPKSIERIEILTGPQASTIYGSNAINGVMQVFTKRGATSRPQLSLSLMSGWVENNFSKAHTPQHDYSAQLNGVEGKLSYNVGGSWSYMGPWSPAKQTSGRGGFGGARLELPTPLGRVTGDMTLRRNITQNQTRGHSIQTWTGYAETGVYLTSNSPGLGNPTLYTLTGQTLGIVLNYAPTNWWSHELGMGSDDSDTEQRITTRIYASVSDTALGFRQNGMNRRSLRYTSTARIPLASLAQATVTAGADAWQSLASSLILLSPRALNGFLSGPTYATRQSGHNTGGFLQTQIGVNDKLFFTYGLRAEWNPDFGEEAQPNYAPRYGVAYTEQLGSVTAKLRGSYGRSTRPPVATIKNAVRISQDWQQYWGPVDQILANPELGPEYQKGGEGGLEMYFGTRGSLVVTRYNQTVDDLIDAPRVDSVDLTPEARALFGVGEWDRDWRLDQYQYLNVGTIRNQGWELQGSINLGPITTRGTYSWTKSRTVGVNPRYRSWFTPNWYPQYQPGASFKFLPEHTWGLGVTYARAATTVGVNATGTGRLMTASNGDDFFYQNLDSRIRLQQNRLNVTASSGAYIAMNNGYAMADLSASHRFVSRVEGVLQVQNLTNRYANDYDARYASLGRQTKAGLRIRTN